MYMSLTLRCGTHQPAVNRVLAGKRGERQRMRILSLTCWRLSSGTATPSAPALRTATATQPRRGRRIEHHRGNVLARPARMRKRLARATPPAEHIYNPMPHGSLDRTAPRIHTRLSSSRQFCHALARGSESFHMLYRRQPGRGRGGGGGNFSIKA